MIKPTNGRIVLFTPGQRNGSIQWYDQPLAAQICHVWNDRLVNLAVTDAVGVAHAGTRVPLLQDGDIAPTEGFYCEWMPYQKGQAAKTEAAERTYLNGVAHPARADGPDPIRGNKCNDPASYCMSVDCHRHGCKVVPAVEVVDRLVTDTPGRSLYCVDCKFTGRMLPLDQQVVGRCEIVGCRKAAA